MFLFLEEFMNIFISEIMNAINTYHPSSQRELAGICGFSLGKINQTLNEMDDRHLIDSETLTITKEGQNFICGHAPRRAVILAAGQGLGMIPIHTELPKALLHIKGETLIERIIRQLHEVNISDITVVTGFMKERMEFLADRYGVQLVYNKKYAVRNNLHSLYLVRDRLEDCYIIPCDILFRANPFRLFEPCSWYMVADVSDSDSMVYMTKQRRLVPCTAGQTGTRMVGPAYVAKEDAASLVSNLSLMDSEAVYHSVFWENAVFAPPKNGRSLTLYGRVINSASYEEINTFEQLRELDSDSPQSASSLLDIAADVLHCHPGQLTNIRSLKKGMTNRSFLFDCHDHSYIMRVPGEGTGELIDRSRESTVYELVSRHGLCEPLLYINADNGYKITKLVTDAANCDSASEADVKRAMDYLRSFHEKKLCVDHCFDLFEQMERYEKMRCGLPSVYDDYDLTKQHIYELKQYVDEQDKEYCLTHIDAVPDNFLMTKERVYLIDWEYAGMQDPHVDIAMFAIYSMYDKKQTDHLIDLYFGKPVSDKIRLKIYCYIAICGLLWSNWCEFKRIKGVEFGEYSIRQYRYAKEYFRYFKNKEVPDRG